MAPTPVSNSGPSLVGNGTVTYYESLFTQQYGSAAGNAYVAYNSAHPGSSAYANAKAFLEIILVSGLDTAIQTAVSGTTTAEGQIPGAAAQGAQNAFNTLDVFKGLNLGSLILRIGEVVLGVVLVAVALNAVLKNPIGKAASVTPVGRAAKVA